jgi:membrane fusion protein, multidrug efflux system
MLHCRHPSGLTPLALIALLTSLGLLGACTPPPPEASVVPAVYVTAVAPTARVQTRQLSAVLGPRVESELGFRTGGLLVERAVDLGQSVRQGQPLARLDPADLRLAEQAAAEQLRAAETDATQSASDAARFARLLADGSIASADVERQRARADAAAARLAQARSQLELTRNRLGYTTLVAPFDGVVTAVRAQRGQVVGEGQPVIALARRGEVEVLADVPEQLAGTLRQHHAEARLATDTDAAETPAVALRLRELAAAAHPVSRSFAARFTVAADGPLPAGWQLGRSVTLSLSRPQAEAAGEPGFELPLGALVDDGRETVVWLVDPADGRLQRQPVLVHAHTAATVRVSGLPEGALVVSVGAHKLDAGMRVRPVRRPLDGSTLAARS